MTAIYTDQVRITLGGVEIEGFSDGAYIVEPAPPERPPRSANVSGRLVMRVHGADAFLDQLATMWMPRETSRYWQRRREFSIRQIRRRAARQLGIPYRVMRQWCRGSMQ